MREQKIALIVFLLGTCAGIIAVYMIMQQVISLGITILGLVVITGIGVLLFARYVSWMMLLGIIGLGILGFGIGSMRMYARMTIDNHQDIVHLGETRVTVTGKIVRDPEIFSDQQRMVIAVDTVQDMYQKSISLHHVRMLVTHDRHELFTYGDEVVFSGVLQMPENFANEQGRVFHYINYLAKDRIFYRMNTPVIHKRVPPRASLIHSMHHLRHVFIERLMRHLPFDEGALLVGQLLGDRTMMSEALEQDFQRSGLIHIVVLSGFNITMVALACVWCISVCGYPRAGLWIAVVGVILFAVFVGGGVTVVRASIMGLLALFARIIGREYDVMKALLIAGFVMMMHNPWILIADISFHLSFLATLSLISFAPLLESWLSVIPTLFGLREVIIQTLSAQFFVTPLLVFSMGQFSIISLIANMVVVPLVPIAMLSGTVLLACSLVLPFLAPLVSVASHVILWLQIFFAHWFASFSWSYISLPMIPKGLVISFYVILFLWVVIRYIRANEQSQGSSFPAIAEIAQ